MSRPRSPFLSRLAAVLLLASLSSALAGIVIEQDVEQAGADGRTVMTMKLSGERARIDIGDQLSSILDLETGSVTSLMHAQKVAMALPQEALAAVKKQAAAQTDKPDLKPTGKKETINGFACEEYVGTFQGLDVTYWVTPDVPNQQAILAQMGRLSGGADPFKAALASGADFPGFPIRTVVRSPQMGASTMTVRSVRETDVPAAEFVVPAGYQQMAMPKMPGAPGAPGGGGGGN